ncbi:MAG: hypothetical protein GY940_08785, partial [bacterium]|nr:hypothetical protein [bacterium]
HSSPTDARHAAQTPSRTLPAQWVKGKHLTAERDSLLPRNSDSSEFNIKELDHLQITLSSNTDGEGEIAETVNISPLPIGSTLDSKASVFHWKTTPGFIGKYELVFLLKYKNGKSTKQVVTVNIGPKFTD